MPVGFWEAVTLPLQALSQALELALQVEGMDEQYVRGYVAVLRAYCSS